MQKELTLTDISAQVARGKAPAVEVHSFEPSLYLIFVRDGDTLTPVQDSRGQTLRFFSRSKALKPLSETGLETADFVHQSAFGEMIGMEGSREQTELRQTVNLSQYRGP